MEARIGQKLPPTHPVMYWLIEHCASILNRHFVTSDGTTAYQHTNGKKSKGQTAEFGEKVLYHVPKKLRGKLSLRWKTGILSWDSGKLK